MENILDWYTPQEAQKIADEKIKEFSCIWKNKKGETMERNADTPEALYFYEWKYNATIYIDTKFEAKKRLQRIIKNQIQRNEF